MRNVFVKADFSGQELRVLAEVSKDERMIDAFNKNYDLHLLTANNVFSLNLSDKYFIKGSREYQEVVKKYAQERHKAKNGVNFPIVYGTSQPLTAKILTPNGWKYMGDIKVGDKIFTANGSKTKIKAIFPQGLRPVYKLTMKDGSSTECDENHLWEIQTLYDKSVNRKRIIPTFNLIKILKMGRKKPQNNCYIDYCSALDFSTKNQAICPYIMGLFLGDGCRSKESFKFSNSNISIIDRVKDLLPLGYKLSKDKGHCYRITTKRIKNKKGQYIESNIFCKTLKELGLYGKYSYEKFIPKLYLYGDVIQRLQLFAGLVDSDGSLNHTAYEYTTTSEQLAKDVQFLVKSLGGRATIKKKPSFGSKIYKGKIINNKRPRYRVFISFPPHCWPNSIQNIEYVGMKECQCIRIEHPSGLYITDDFIVTHNSEYGISKRLGVSVEEAKRWIKEFFRLYPGVKKAVDKTVRELEKQEWVATIMGRRRRFPGYNKMNWREKSKIRRQAFNHKIQGASADISKIAGKKLLKHLPEYNAKVVLFVHDEYVFECPKDMSEMFAKKVKEVMENSVSLSVKMIVDVSIVNCYGD